MLNNQNKEVKTKFQNERRNFAAKSKSSKSTLSGTSSARSQKITSPVGSPRCLNECKKEISDPKKVTKPEQMQLIKPPKKIEVTPKLKAKSVENCCTSRSRSAAATLKRISRPFVSTCRIYRPSSSKIFDYHLSREEQSCFAQSPSPMKSVPSGELQLLRSGQRATYLETRYERTPDVKYNYPEATSWRYGWFHRKAT